MAEKLSPQKFTFSFKLVLIETKVFAPAPKAFILSPDWLISSHGPLVHRPLS